MKILTLLILLPGKQFLDKIRRDIEFYVKELLLMLSKSGSSF
ncbi:MAG: hypothetical protein ACRYE9_01035 [Janthinobacterium lividum]